MRLSEVSPLDTLSQRYSDMIVSCDTLQSLRENLYKWRELAPDAYLDVRNWNQDHMLYFIRLVNIFRLFRQLPRANPSVNRLLDVMMPPQLKMVTILAKYLDVPQGQALQWGLSNKFLYIDRAGSYKALQSTYSPESLVTALAQAANSEHLIH